MKKSLDGPMRKTQTLKHIKPQKSLLPEMTELGATCIVHIFARQERAQTAVKISSLAT